MIAAVRRILQFTALLIVAGSSAAADQADAVDFVHEVRPILQRHCHSCHGTDKQRGGLRLDVRSEAFKGGDSHGASILPGDPEHSPLVRFVSGADADLKMPPKGGLTDAEIATLTRWVESGAAWPEGADLGEIDDKRDHWSFRAVIAPKPPAVKAGEWPRNAIDHFILAALEQAGLEPAPATAPEAWLRRVTFNLTGLPPDPEEITTFLDELRRAPRDDSPYERAVDRLLSSPRYGERWARHWLDVVRYADTHGFEVNTERPHAWPYRDYVIAAFNRDVPYQQFVREQIAGDALGEDPATGFLVTASVLLPGQIGADEASKRLARQDAIDEIVVNIGQTFLGLSVGCARCHDHKSDPISQRDYYSMQSFVAGVEYVDRELTGADAEGRPVKVVFGGFRAPDAIRLLARGNPEQPREEVAPAVPEALGSLTLPMDAEEKRRRLALADWIADPRNPLTARVMVNRIWQGHFGVGIVETASDFGRSGMPPSHPELLDWLATEFMRAGWSVKHLQRLIVLTSTYRQSTRFDPAAAARDADARLLWRYPPRRLEGEEIRDAMLASSGRLDLAMGGPGFNLFDQRGGLSGFVPVESFEGEGLRRMIYAHQVRRERDPVFGAFDIPDGGQSAARRRESTTPFQALNLFNSRFTLDESEALAKRVLIDVGDDSFRQIRHAWLLVLNREPTPVEQEDAKRTIENYGLPTLCRVLFNSNEFLFIP